MKKVAVFATVFLFVTIACKGRGKPPEVAVGTACAADGRSIQDLSLASVARSSDGTVKAFDRASCLLETIPPGDQWQVWFHDNDGPQWIDSTKAVFVIQRSGAGGPVRYIRAFKDSPSAEAFYERTSGRNEIAPDYQTLRGVMSHE